MVNTNSLSPAKKQLLWRGIKRAAPPLADMLKNDVVIQRLKDEFQASIQFSEQDFDRFMTAGQSAINGDGN